MQSNLKSDFMCAFRMSLVIETVMVKLNQSEALGFIY